MEDPKIEFEGTGVTNKFWNILMDLFKVKSGYKGTIYDFAAECDFSATDGFFYEKVLPHLTKNRIFKEIPEENKRAYMGRTGKVYEISRDDLTKFIIIANPRLGKLYKIWVKELDNNMGWKTAADNE